MTRLLLTILSAVILFGPVVAQQPIAPKTEAEKLQAEMRQLADRQAKLEALLNAAEKGKEPPLAPPAGSTGYKPPTPQQRRALHLAAAQRHGNRLAMHAKFQELPPAFDCRDKGWVLPIGDQGSCGSCYLYSTIYGTLSQAFVKAGYGKPDGSFVMSVQFGMDRPRSFGGCSGGYGLEVIDWVQKNGWVAESYIDLDGKVNKDYPPYEARSGSDRTKPDAKKWKIADFGFATGDQSNRPPTIAELKSALWNYGTLNVAVAAGGQFSNGTGTITQLGTSIDHEIEVVAYDDNHDNGDGTKGALLLKNQWRKSWGVNGYRWCSYNAAKRLVDFFWVSVQPLPPPPPLVIVAAVPDGAALPGVPYNVMPVVTGGTAPYSWSFDYGDGSSGAAMSHTYAANGVYKVVGTVTDAKGLTAGDTGTVTVGTVPPPPPDGEFAQIIVDRTLQPGTYIALPKSVLDRLRALDAERQQLLNPSGNAPPSLPEIKERPQQ